VIYERSYSLTLSRNI